MKWFESEESGVRPGWVALGIGIAGGVAAGIVAVSRLGREGLREVGDEVRERVARTTDRMTPARVRTGADRVLTRLEDDVLDAFLEDEILGRRGIDVGAIGQGIIELSGTVHDDEESQHAVSVARTVDGVTTVVNRLAVEPPVPRRRFITPQSEDRGHWTGRNVGMGRMRQAPETEPDRRDDSQKLQDRALAEADRSDAMTVSPERLEDENSMGTNQSVGKRDE